MKWRSCQRNTYSIGRLSRLFFRRTSDPNRLFVDVDEQHIVVDAVPHVFVVTVWAASEDGSHVSLGTGHKCRYGGAVQLAKLV